MKINTQTLSAQIGKTATWIPRELADLPTVEAEKWAQISTDSVHPGCEGPAFDKNGNLFVCHVPPGYTPDRRIVKINRDGSVETFMMTGDSSPVGIAFHKDGRMFATCLSGDAAGDYTTLTPICTGVAWANGISLYNNCLWVGAGGENAVIRIKLDANGFASSGSNSCNIIYRNSGVSFPDSNKIDAEGNLYQAIMGAGRIVILNSEGLPIANVLAPGCKEKRNLKTSNLAIKPKTCEGYMLAAGPEDGTAVYRFETIAPAQKLFGTD